MYYSQKRDRKQIQSFIRFLLNIVSSIIKILKIQTKYVLHSTL